MDIIIRNETPADYREVEYLIRESFWNVYRPGCLEHFVIHELRNDPAFVKELDFVMEKDGRIIGQNMFMRTVINTDDGRVVPVLTMGPIGILPELKRQGYGKALLDYSLEKATELGFGAVLFEGNIDFYGKDIISQPDPTAVAAALCEGVVLEQRTCTARCESKSEPGYGQIVYDFDSKEPHNVTVVSKFDGAKFKNYLHSTAAQKR